LVFLEKDMTLVLPILSFIQLMIIMIMIIIIIIIIIEIGWGDMEWIDQAEDRDQRRAHVNTVMNLLVPYSIAKSLSI
jgi:hypothetical protein